MHLGILSDTHGNVRRTEQAVGKLLAAGAQVLCHCGDIGSESVLITIAAACTGPKVPVHAVLGNVDLWESGVRDFPAGAGVAVHGRKAELELGGKRIAIIHGDDHHLLDEAIRSQSFDYILTGHTHTVEDTREGRTRIINPGALQRTSSPSVALLDLTTDSLRHLTLS